MYEGAAGEAVAGRAMRPDTIVWIASMIIFVPGMMLSINADSTRFPWPFFVIFPIFFVVMIASLIFGIIGAVKASHLKRWRYPLRIPFFRAPRPL